MNWPSNWEKCESEYNRHYDPYAEKCPHCFTETDFEDDEDDEGQFYYCPKCGHRVEMQ